MQNFVFHNPTKIIFGQETELQIGDQLKQAAIKKILLVYGQNSIKKSGLYERILSSLHKAQIQFVEHPGVVANPVLSHTRAGIQKAKMEKVGAILAVGGGSVLDESKAIAVGAKATDDIWQYFIGKEITTALPVFTILTIAATGSEMNGGSVLTNEETKEKLFFISQHVYPKTSIINPALMLTVPANYTAYSAVDALSHVLEGYFTATDQGILQYRLVESIIKTIMESTELCLKNPADYQARADFAWAATLALNGLTTAGIGNYYFPCHMLEHPLSAHFNLPHGAGLSIVTPAWMKWFIQKNPKPFARLAQEIFGLSKGEQGAQALENWFKKIGSPVRLKELNINKKQIQPIINELTKTVQNYGMADYNQQVLKAIFDLML